MEGEFGESVGEAGLLSSTAEVLEELLLASCGLLPFIWLCRLANGGVGGLFGRASDTVSSSGLSLLSIGKEGSKGGGGKGLFKSFVLPIGGL